MLTPHHRKDPQLGEVWLAPKNFFDPLKFFRAETMFRHQLRSNNRIGGRFGADHRQRTLTELKRDSTRLVNNSLTLVLSLSEKGEEKQLGPCALIAGNSARFPSPLRSRRGNE